MKNIIGPVVYKDDLVSFSLAGKSGKLKPRNEISAAQEQVSMGVPMSHSDRGIWEGDRIFHLIEP